MPNLKWPPQRLLTNCTQNITAWWAHAAPSWKHIVVYPNVSIWAWTYSKYLNPLMKKYYSVKPRRVASRRNQMQCSAASFIYTGRACEPIGWLRRECGLADSDESADWLEKVHFWCVGCFTCSQSALSPGRYKTRMRVCEPHSHLFIHVESTPDLTLTAVNRSLTHTLSLPHRSIRCTHGVPCASLFVQSRFRRITLYYTIVINSTFYFNPNPRINQVWLIK